MAEQEYVCTPTWIMDLKSSKGARIEILAVSVVMKTGLESSLRFAVVRNVYITCVSSSANVVLCR